MHKLTLTFDNGPKLGDTDRILDILAARGVLATFFVLGRNMLDAPTRALAVRAHAEGHWIGNHTMRHLVPLGLSDDPDHPAREIGEADAAIGNLAHPDKFFRPPGKASLGPHLLSRSALDYCVAHRHTVVTWNNIPRDGIEPRDGWVGRALAAATGQDWTVTIVHDHHLGHAMHNLAEFIDRAKDTGVTFVQEFSASVLPVLRGEIRQPIGEFVMRSNATSSSAPLH